MPRLSSDTNGDGDVDFADFNQLANHFGSTDATKVQGDSDGDGDVDFADVSALSCNFGRNNLVELDHGNIVNSIFASDEMLQALISRWK